MNVNLRLNKDEEVMMSALLIKMPKFRRKRNSYWRKHYAPITRTKSERGSRDERYTPPPVEEEMTSQMAHYKATLRKLTEVSGDGLTRGKTAEN